MIFLPLRQRHEYMSWIFRFRRSGAAEDLTEALGHGGARADGDVGAPRGGFYSRGFFHHGEEAEMEDSPPRVF
jgi:hypothetical protein